jgi:hypothetical protein
MERGTPVGQRTDRSSSRYRPGAGATPDRDPRHDCSQSDLTSRIARENDELVARLHHITPLLAGLATELATVRRAYTRLKRDHETLRAQLDTRAHSDHSAAGE